MIAIHTKFIPPTNTKGARIKAYTTTGFSRTISYPYSSGSVEGHFEAVLAMVKKHNLDWDLSNMRYGDSCDSKGYTFCFDASITPSVNNQLISEFELNHIDRVMVGANPHLFGESA